MKEKKSERNDAAKRLSEKAAKAAKSKGKLPKSRAELEVFARDLLRAFGYARPGSGLLTRRLAQMGY